MKTYFYSGLVIAGIVACGGSKDKKPAPALPDESLQVTGGGETSEGSNTNTTQTPVNKDDNKHHQDTKCQPSPSQNDDTSQNDKDDSSQNDYDCADNSLQNDQNKDESSQNDRHKDDSGQSDKDDSGQNGNYHDDSEQNGNHEDNSGQNDYYDFSCNMKTLTFDGRSNRFLWKHGSPVRNQLTRLEITTENTTPRNSPPITYDTEKNTASAHNGLYDLYLGSHSPLGNVLAIANSRNFHTYADDAPLVSAGFSTIGGTLVFNFDRKVILKSLSSVDLDGHESVLFIYDLNGRTIGHSQVLSSPNIAKHHSIKSHITRKIKVKIHGTGGIDNIKYCEAK